LWAAFAGTVYHSLTAFNGRMAVAAVAGAIFAPLSYIAGAKFGAVELGASVMLSYIFIALGRVDLCCTYFDQQCIGSHININASDTMLA
ncbi:MAG: DUF2878 family protein, partial [Pseudomonadota bacterium]|nr:DUF2878 family protein [Pseudomonadota bacterium]